MEGRPDMFKPLGVQTARSIRKNKGGLVTGRWQSDWVGVRTLKDMVFVSSGERGVIAFQMTSEGMVARKAFPWGGHTVHDMTEDNDRFTLLLRQQGGFADRCWVGVCHWKHKLWLEDRRRRAFRFPGSASDPLSLPQVVRATGPAISPGVASPQQHPMTQQHDLGLLLPRIYDLQEV